MGPYLFVVAAVSTKEAPRRHTWSRLRYRRGASLRKLITRKYGSALLKIKKKWRKKRQVSCLPQARKQALWAPVSEPNLAEEPPALRSQYKLHILQALYTTPKYIIHKTETALQQIDRSIAPSMVVFVNKKYFEQKPGCKECTIGSGTCHTRPRHGNVEQKQN